MTRVATDDPRGETSEVAFTFDWYADFLDALCRRGLRFRSYDDSLRDGDVVVRHDVDWSPRNALTTARIEADRGVTATYFFLLTSPLYNVFHRRNRRIVEKIASLGHRVGTHFSTHQYWDREPPEDVLTERVQDEQRALDTVVDELDPAVSFHRPPEWVLAREFDALVSAYEPRFFESVAYRADSNQRWRDDHPLAGGVPETMQVLTHPGLWGKADADYEARLAAHEDEELGRTRKFMEDQFVDKRYNAADFCEFERRY